LKGKLVNLKSIIKSTKLTSQSPLLYLSGLNVKIFYEDYWDRFWVTMYSSFCVFIWICIEH